MHPRIHAAIVIASLTVPSASALTMGEFSDICQSAPVSCTEHPMIRAYVGGALDLLATLDEQTGYLDEIYCVDPSELFDVSTIIGFMARYREAYETRNAMLVLVRYLEQNGGCEADG